MTCVPVIVSQACAIARKLAGPPPCVDSYLMLEFVAQPSPTQTLVGACLGGPLKPNVLVASWAQGTWHTFYCPPSDASAFECEVYAFEDNAFGADAGDKIQISIHPLDATEDAANLIGCTFDGAVKSTRTQAQL